MLIDEQTSKAIGICIDKSIAFALYSTPSKNDVDFFASNQVHFTSKISDVEGEAFVVSPFMLSDKLDYYYFNRTFTAQDILSKDIHGLEFSHQSWPHVSLDPTTKEEYIKSIEITQSSLNNRSEKVVISRIHKERTTKNVCLTAQQYFEENPDCFCFLYFIPTMGLWLGASPELLIDYNRRNGIFSTMSLAGTRNKNSQQGWDTKNIEEHDIVTHHITTVISNHTGHSPAIKAENVNFGDIQHLCHRLMSNHPVDLSKLLPDLSPTPALLGYPREKALNIIHSVEQHSRQCYGGFIGVVSDTQTLLYVNLRCAKITTQQDGYLYECFGGGGITLLSDPYEEWKETENKIAPILKAIKS